MTEGKTLGGGGANGEVVGAWRLDPGASEVAFRTRYAFFLPVRGTFGGWSGRIRLDEGNLDRSAVEIEIDAAGISTGIGLRDWHLRTFQFLGVKRFPTIRFESRHVEAYAEDGARIYGDLTVKGVRGEVVLDAERLERGADRQVWSATTTLDRYDYGVTMGKVFEGFGTMVDNVVEVELTIVAERAPAASAALSRTGRPVREGGGAA